MKVTVTALFFIQHRYINTDDICCFKNFSALFWIQMFRKKSLKKCYSVQYVWFKISKENWFKIISCSNFL